jgi:hypothetical protein
MSIDDDFFDLQHYIEEDGSPRNRDCMLAILSRVQDFQNGLIHDRDELNAQVDVLKSATVLKVSDIKLTNSTGDRKYIHLEVKS